MIGILADLQFGEGEVKFPEIHTARLDNGLRVILIEKRSLPLVDGQLVILSGALADPENKYGLASTTVRMLLRGTQTRSAEQIAVHVDNAGADLVVRSDWETTRISFHALREELPNLLDICGDLVRSPRFSEDSLKEEIKRTTAEIENMVNDNWATADRWFASKLYRGNRNGRLMLGEPESLNRVTLDDVKTFFGSHYVPNNAVFILGGDVGNADLALVESRLGSWTRGKIVPGKTELVTERVEGNSAWIVDNPLMSQTQIRIGNIGLTRTNPDYYSALVLNTLFGGGFSCRLMEELRRKRGLTYGVSSQLDAGRTAGPFYIWTFASYDNTREVIRLILEQMSEVHRGNIGHAEVEAAKNFLSGMFADRMQTPNAISEMLLKLVMDGQPLEKVRTHVEKIRAVALSDVKRAAANYIDPENNIIVILGNRTEIEPRIKDLKLKVSFASVHDN